MEKKPDTGVEARAEGMHLEVDDVREVVEEIRSTECLSVAPGALWNNVTQVKQLNLKIFLTITLISNEY